MPAGMSFIQLEGNYVISFRDTSDCLPAFTAVRLDRRRGSLDSGVFLGGSSGALASSGNGGLASSSAFGGSARDLLSTGDASPTARRQRSGSLSKASHKFVVTGIPRSVSTELIKTRLEDAIPGIERVYRDPDMAGKLSHPPVILETRLAYARDAFMLRSDWIPVVQRLIKGASGPATPAQEEDDVGVRFDVHGGGLGAEQSGGGRESERRQSLLELSVTCPHGRYRGDNTCQICRHQSRRYTFVADDFLSHAGSASGPIADGLRQQQDQLGGKSVAKSKQPSCLSCLFRVLPRRSPPRPDTPPPSDEPSASSGIPTVVTIPASPEETTPPGGSFLLQLPADIQRRRFSAYDDVRLNSGNLNGEEKLRT